MAPTCGIVINCFGISLHRAVRGPNRVTNPEERIHPRLIYFYTHVLPVIALYAMRKLYVILCFVSSANLCRLPQTKCETNLSMAPDALVLSSTIIVLTVKPSLYTAHYFFHHVLGLPCPRAIVTFGFATPGAKTCQPIPTFHSAGNANVNTAMNLRRPPAHPLLLAHLRVDIFT